MTIKVVKDTRWINAILPHLPPQHYNTYIDLLSLYIPNAEKSNLPFRFYESTGSQWSFPFVFDEGDVTMEEMNGFEEWMEYVDSCMMQDYGLPEEMLCG